MKTFRLCILMFIAPMVLSGQAGQRDTVPESGNYYWGELGLGNSSLEYTVLVSANAAVDKHLFSIQIQGMSSMELFSYQEKMDYFGLYYGRIKRTNTLMAYAKCGVGWANFIKKKEDVTGQYVYGRDAYRGEMSFAIPLEAGLGFHYRFFSLQLCTGLVVTKYSQLYIGLKLGLGDFN